MNIGIAISGISLAMVVAFGSALKDSSEQLHSLSVRVIASNMAANELNYKLTNLEIDDRDFSVVVDSHIESAEEIFDGYVEANKDYDGLSLDINETVLDEAKDYAIKRLEEQR